MLESVEVFVQPLDLLLPSMSPFEKNLATPTQRASAPTEAAGGGNRPAGKSTEGVISPFLMSFRQKHALLWLAEQCFQEQGQYQGVVE